MLPGAKIAHEQHVARYEPRNSLRVVGRKDFHNSGEVDI